MPIREYGLRDLQPASKSLSETGLIKFFADRGKFDPAHEADKETLSAIQKGIMFGEIGDEEIEGFMSAHPETSPFIAQAVAIRNNPELLKMVLGVKDKTKKGLYGGVRTGQRGAEYVEYGYDEDTHQPVLLTPPEGVKPTVPLSPQVVTGGNIVSLPGRGVPGARPTPTATGLQIPATAGEAGEAAQQFMATDLIKRFEQAFPDKKMDKYLGPADGRKLRIKSKFASELSKEEGQILSIESQLETMLLDAIRGANVGPAEQLLFRQQLPRIEQPSNLFRANLENTKRNLELLQYRKAQLRPVPGPNAPETVPQQQQAPQSNVPAGAKQAPDGNWYIPDPNRPGKFLKVTQ